MNRKLMFSSKNNCWCTPKDFFKKLDDEFHFTLDPCATEKSALCKTFFTPEQDGLKQNWVGHRAFVNPPYGRMIGKWVYKCLTEVIYGCELAVMLIPARTDTRWFHNYILDKAEIRFIKGRLKFIDIDFEGDEKNRKISPAPFPSMLVIYK